LALIAIATLSLLWIERGSADNTVTLLITSAGPLSAAVLDGSLVPVDSSPSDQRDTGTLRLVVRDQRGTSEGWAVSIVASDFDYLGTSPLGRDIPSSGFRIVTVEPPLVVFGQPRGENGPYTTAISNVSLDTPRTVMWAAPGGGSGDYEQRIGVELDIPAGSQPGIYLTTLTLAYTSAP